MASSFQSLSPTPPTLSQDTTPHRGGSLPSRGPLTEAIFTALLLAADGGTGANENDGASRNLLRRPRESGGTQRSEAQQRSPLPPRRANGGACGGGRRSACGLHEGTA